MNDDTSRQDELAQALPASDWEALARFLSGESAPDEVDRIQAWLEAHPAERALVDQLNAAEWSWDLADVDVEAALAKVHRQMERPAAVRDLRLERVNSPAPRSTSPARPRRLAIAAGFLAAAAVMLVVALRVSTRSAAPVQSVAAQTYSTRTGQRDSIVLSDGSRVILGPDSRLVVAADYGVRARAVELEGDGYFDVRHDASKPFQVQVANAVIEDIGTTFTIESDAGDTTSVSVLSGSVRLRANQSAQSDGAILAAGDRGSLTSSGDVRAYPKAVRSDDAAWTTGRVVFHDASLTRIAGELRRWYGVDLRVADPSLAQRHVTTTFDDGDSIDQVLKSIALSLGARVERQGTSATIYSNRGT